MPSIRMTKNGEIINLIHENIEQHEQLGWELLDNDQEVVILRKTLILSDEEIKALPTTPVELIPAQGSGKIIVPVYVMIVTNGFETNPYDAPDGDSWIVIADGTHDLMYLYVNDSGIPVTYLTYLLTGNYGDGAISFASLPNHNILDGWGVTPNTTQLTGYANTALNIYADNASAGDFTGGDPSNTMTITILYAVIDL